MENRLTTAGSVALGFLCVSGLLAVLGADSGVTLFCLTAAGVAGIVHLLALRGGTPRPMSGGQDADHPPATTTLTTTPAAADYAQGRPVAHVQRDAELPPLDVPGTPPADLGRMSDQALCQAWRVSYVRIRRLQQLPHAGPALGRASIERGRYLGELERRNPAGFSAWIAAGARAASDPSRYLVRDAGAGNRGPEPPAEPASEDSTPVPDERGGEQDVTDSSP